MNHNHPSNLKAGIVTHRTKRVAFLAFLVTEENGTPGTPVLANPRYLELPVISNLRSHRPVALRQCITAILP